MAKTLTIIGLQTIPIVKEGDDIPALIIEACKRESVSIEDGDIIVVTQKIVSKAEGRVYDLENIVPSKKALELGEATQRDPRLIELVLSDTVEVVKATPEGLIVRNIQGNICLNAGADRSNVPGETIYSLLPVNPDESSKIIRKGLQKIINKRIAVIITDTYSRPFRRGQVDLAIGFSGIFPFRDYRHTGDLYGKELRVKNTTIIDEIASVTELVIGQSTEAIPVSIVKNLTWVDGDVGMSEILLSQDEDLFKGAL
ncbi:MAG: Coenzyme F420:L-glutamate ligase [candidate division WS2 bacterium]|uniref:Coenzyme F420:L-glutamate ligase n=1 Tax=Psychracetigena formicireducens TaxID=2986056 RepID=A0A9E2BHP4_PSYF1|nr:Coenzyme F420:L-glutamate ligase [Candidatus Psychracetigena formicireducens]MBT9144340.1 Coenzyme F420:L-glutamate ligase [Candidatus Psychracetigena formicireducens]